MTGRSVLVLLFFLWAEVAVAQGPAANGPGGLPEAWQGTWKGEVTSQSPRGSGAAFQMELRIAPTEKPDSSTWTILYDGPQGRSERPYLLIADPSQPGRFQIDEQNGIMIEATLIGSTLSSHFTVGGQTLWSRYTLRSSGKDAEIEFELCSANEERATNSGGQNGVPAVRSLPVSSRQTGVLRRAGDRQASGHQGAIPAWRNLATEPSRGKQDDIFFLDENRGWYANGAGKIFRTTDGGATWTQQVHMPGTYFRCLAFVDERHGFAGNIGPGYFPNVTDSVPLYETKDGGESWQPVTTIAGPPVVGLCALQVLREPFVNAGQLDERLRIIGVGRVGGPAAMIISDDLGATWQPVNLGPHAAMAFDVHFFNRNEGVVAAATDADVQKSNALILTTSDGGKTWTRAWQSQRPFELTWKIAFPTRDVGYVTIQSYNPDPAVKERFVAKTTDGGRTWAQLTLTGDARVREFGVAFATESLGWVGAMPNGFQTTDGGTTWTPVEMGNAVNRIRLIRTPQGIVGYAIGLNVYRLDLTQPMNERVHK